MMDDDETDERVGKSVSLEKTPSCGLTKEVLTLDHVEFEIETCLKDKKSLREVIEKLEKKFGCKLSNFDCYIVEDKYVDHLINFWIDEGLHLASSGFDPTQPLKFIEVLTNISNFSESYKLFGNSNSYNTLISNLSETSLSLKSRESELVCELKKRCCFDTLSKTTKAKCEITFVQNFLEVLKSYKSIQLFCQLFQVKEFLNCANEVGLKLILSSLLNSSVSSPKLCKLKNSAKSVSCINEYFFIKDLKASITAYLEPVVIKQSNVDGRSLLEVSGKHIVISNELEEIEKSPRFSYIEEVRFVGAGVVHVDADLLNTVWHGKNIVIYGETLIVSAEKCVTWDVSGKDADFTAMQEAAGTSEDGLGLQGEDGSPGESGGNVCILVESIENHKNFKIVSNGGKGCRGQNGGPGIDGRNGKYIDAYKFNENFPPVSHVLKKESHYLKTIESVCQGLLSVNKLHYGLSEFDTDLTNEEFVRIVKHNPDLKNIYLETTTEEGCKITFSFYNEDLFSCCQSFLLHKGALGSVGQMGGAGGCGGKGGFFGDVNVQAVKDTNVFTCKIAKNGEDGKMGLSGKTGNCGRSGLDRGYMDCSLSLLQNIMYSENWPKIYTPGPRDTNKLTVKYHNDKKKNTVKCPHNGLYAEITPMRKPDYSIDHISQRTHVVHKQNENQKIHAIRKKNICQRSILEQYKEKDSVCKTWYFENAFENIKAEMDNLTIDTSKGKKSAHTAKINRQMSYCHDKWYEEENKIDVKLENIEYDIENEDTNNMDLATKETNWKISRRFDKVVKKLLSITNSTKQSISSSDSISTFITKPSSEGIETQNISLSTHLVNMLESLYDSLPLDHVLKKYRNMKSQSTNSRFLEETHNVINREPFHLMVKEFFCEDSYPHRVKVVNSLGKYYLNQEPLQETFKSFILGSENDCKNKAIIKLGKQYNDFIQSKELKLKQKLMPLKNELLSKAENKHLNDYLLCSVLKQSTESKIKFENEIARDTFLSYLYRSFVDELKTSFDWEMEHFDINDAFLVFQKCMLDSGPFAVSFREFLAHEYKVNILVYTTNDENKLVLVSNHNPKAGSEMHFLLKRNRFVMLNFDYEFARLFENYKHLGNALNKIMFQVCSFENSQQISDYISESSFTSVEYSGLSSTEVIRVKIHHILNEESYVNTISNSYMSQKDVILVKCRLDKLKSEFIGYENILHYMALHFDVEGNQMTVTELCFVINQILQFSVGESKVMTIVSWIIAAQPQKLWVPELALLKIELYFKSQLKQNIKLKWRKFLKDQTENYSLMVFLQKLDCETCQISVISMDELLYLMSKVPKSHIGLENVTLSEWKYYLKDRFWAHHVKSITNWSKEQLKTLSFYFITWENTVGKTLCMKLVQILIDHANEIKSESNKDFILKVLKSLNNKEVCFSDDLWNILSKNEIKNWLKVIDNECLNTVSERSLQTLVKLTASGNTSKNILDMLPDIESTIKRINVSRISLKEDLDEKKLKTLFLDELNPNKREISVLFRLKSFLAGITPDESTFAKTLEVLLDFIRPRNQRLSFKSNLESFNSNLKEDLSNSSNQFGLYNQNIYLPLIELCINLTHKKWLRDTQKLAIVTLLTNAKNSLAQVSTGEGKSLIVVAIAIIKALSNEKVNIVTSSKVLAKRDSVMYKDIYELCGLMVGDNSSENIEERKKVYSNCQVIYGDLANFQRDYLLDRVYNQNILGDSSFETVIVDEVDSMLLDKGNNVLYLTHDIPGLDKIEPVLTYIWKLISRPISSEQFEDLFSVQAIKEHIMYELFGVISKENIKQLDISMTDKQVDRTWEFLIENEVINHSGKVLKESVNSSNIDGLNKNCIPKIHLKYILEKVIDREKILNIPKYLHQFVEDHLESWIKSGISAVVMESGRDYIVDVDRSETATDINPIITILDKDTGTDLVSSQWDEALHQFLQLKHGCKLSLLNLKAVFISNVSYLGLYKTLYGLSGTLGSSCERDLLKEVYDVDFVTIPTAKVKKFSEEPSILCFSFEEWKQNIFEEVCKTVNKKRSALVICETIKEVSMLKEKFIRKFGDELIHIYTRDYEKLTVAESLQPGCIIISTNLAGRGTDIKLSHQLIANGGLYVCLTFLPSNLRVEEQAYGRAARNGEPGTAQIIFRTTKKSASKSAAQVIDIKKQRDINESKRLAVIKSYYETQIQVEEKWFRKFRETYDNLLKQIKQEEDVKNILLQAFLNQWAFWLDSNKKLLFSISNSQEIYRSLEKFLTDWSKLENVDLKDWIKLITDPAQLVKLGLAFLKVKEFPNSLLLFDKVIKEEPYFSETAQYYKVVVNAKQRDQTNTDILEPLKVVAKKLKERAESAEMSALEINCLKEKENVNLIQLDCFLDQQTNISKIYGVILQSISNIVGEEIIPETFIIPGRIEKHVAKDIFRNLINVGLLKKPTIKSNIKIDELLFVKNYGLCPNQMYRFIHQFKGKEYQEHQFLETFKKDYVVHSRETFWEELVNNKSLVGEESYVFIDMQELWLFHPSLCERIKPKTVEKFILSKLEVWLYQPETLVQIKDSSALSFIKKDELNELIGSNMFQLLDKKDIFIYNKLATFDPSKNIVFNSFDALSKKDFQKVNICEETASIIMEDLINQHVIKKKSIFQPELYHLSIDAENIEHIELTTLKAYTLEVRSLMSVCFAFRIAFEQLKLLTMNTFDVTCPPLPAGLHEKIVFELKKNEIIEQTYVDVAEDVSKTLDELYPKSMNKDGYKKLLLESCCEMNCDGTEIEKLIANEWIIKNDTAFTNPQNQTYFINSEKFKPKKDNRSPVDDKNESKLSPLHSEIDTVIKTIVNRFFLIEHLDYFKQVLTSSKGQYLKFETPSFSLNPLLDVLIDKKLSSEIEIFALNGLDQLIVLEEKKFTWKTQRNILCIVIVGVCQIALGVVLQVLFPTCSAGSSFIVSGMSDLIFSLGCLFTGHCPIKDYLVDKVVSIAIAFSKVFGMFRSGFGQKAAGMSFQSIKQGFTGAFRKDSIAKTVAVGSSVRIVTAISQGLIYATVDNVIEPELNKISHAITEVVCSNINETVCSHPINRRIREIRSRYCHDNSKLTLEVCFSKHTCNLKDKLSHSFSNTVPLIETLMRENIRKFQNHSNFGYLEIFELCKNIVNAIEVYRSLFTDSVKQINDVLDAFDEDLKITISSTEKSSLNQSPISEEDLNLFVISVCDDLKTEIKNQISDSLTVNLLSPALQFLTNHLVKSSTKFFMKSRAISRSDDIRKKNVSGYKGIQAKEKLERDSHIFHEFDYEERLLDLLQKKRSVALFTEIMRKNVSVDTNFIEMCCFVLPKALKNEGVEIPNLEILVERNGSYQRFPTIDDKCEKTTIIIAPDSDFVCNVFKNRTLIKSGVDLILTKISQEYPALSGRPIENLRSYMAEKIENAFGTHTQFPTMYSDLSYTKNCFKIIESVEQKIPYQHFHVGGKYVFNTKVDVDLRKEEKLTSLSLTEDHIFKGFLCALNKINDHIHKVQDHLRHFMLTLKDFEETSYEITPQTNKAMSGNFHCFATHFKLVMPFVVELSTRRLEDFTIAMSLNTQVKEKIPYLPYGPHIAYEISPKVHCKYLNKGIKGHVLINEECSEYSFCVKNCHIAGELILPTGFQLQKTCKVLMLGDSLFKSVSEVASYPIFAAKSYSNFDDLKSSNLTLSYKGLQYVVLILRTSSLFLNMSGGEITSKVSEVSENIQGQFEKTKIVVCSLFKAQGVDVNKITQTNKCLKIYCSKMNIKFLETNGFMSSKDLEDNGINLKRRGLTKILKHVNKLT